MHEKSRFKKLDHSEIKRYRIERRSGKDRRHYNAKILAPDRRHIKDRRSGHIKFKVPAHIYLETVCSNDFSCLSSCQCGDNGKCKMEKALGEHGLVLQSKEFSKCHHRDQIGSLQICTCPTRIYLFQKYGVGF